MEGVLGTVSFCLLTWNRKEITTRAITHNLDNAGYPISQVVICDNGSTDGMREWLVNELKPHTLVLNNENQGCGQGYNCALSQAREDFIVLADTDVLFNDGWLKTMVEHFERIHNTGVISMYFAPVESIPHRHRPGPTVVNGLPIVPCLPMDVKMFRRDLLKKVGYFREDMGKYGYVDVVFGDTMERVCKDNRLLHYAVPGLSCRGIGNDDVPLFAGEDPKQYREFKNKELANAEQARVMEDVRVHGFPYYSPY